VKSGKSWSGRGAIALIVFLAVLSIRAMSLPGEWKLLHGASYEENITTKIDSELQDLRRALPSHGRVSFIDGTGALLRTFLSQMDLYASAIAKSLESGGVAASEGIDPGLLAPMLSFVRKQYEQGGVLHGKAKSASVIREFLRQYQLATMGAAVSVFAQYALAPVILDHEWQPGLTLGYFPDGNWASHERAKHLTLRKQLPHGWFLFTGK